MYYFSPCRWRNYEKCYVSSRQAQKLSVWESTQTRRRYSVTRTKWRQNRSRLITSKSRYWQKGDSAQYLGPKITLDEQETEDDQKQAECSVGSVPQISSRVDIEKLPLLPQTSSFRKGHHANIDLRQWNVDIIIKTWKEDQDCETKDASTYRTDKRPIQSKQRCSQQYRRGNQETRRRRKQVCDR